MFQDITTIIYELLNYFCKIKDQKIYCPMSSKPLTMKDLFEVKFKLFEDKDNEKKALISRNERYVCPVSNDILSNSVPCVFLKTRY